MVEIPLKDHSHLQEGRGSQVREADQDRRASGGGGWGIMKIRKKSFKKKKKSDLYYNRCTEVKRDCCAQLPGHVISNPSLTALLICSSPLLRSHKRESPGCPQRPSASPLAGEVHGVRWETTGMGSGTTWKSTHGPEEGRL